jgi:hypothetical protein
VVVFGRVEEDAVHDVAVVEGDGGEADAFGVVAPAREGEGQVVLRVAMRGKPPIVGAYSGERKTSMYQPQVAEVMLVISLWVWAWWRVLALSGWEMC